MANLLQPLMEKPVTRRQFLTHMSLVIVGLLGFNSFISLLTDPKRHLKLSSGEKSRRGFGAGPFGV